MSLFGSTGSQQPGQSGGLFGGLGSNTNTQQQPSGGLFGNTSNTTNTGQPGSGIFGNAGGSGGGLFGSTSTTNTQNQGSGGLFGNTNNQQQPSSGGLFGNTSTNTTNQQQQPNGGGLFGNTNTSTTTQQQPSGGGLFGNTNTNTTQQQQPSGGLFGNTNTTNQQPTTGGLFGNTSTATNMNTNQPPTLTLNTGGGLFGNTSTSSNTNPLFGNKPPGSIFGNTSATTSTGATNPNPANPLFGGGSLFGNTNTNNNQQQPTGGLFGATGNQQQQQQPTTGLFGTTSTQQQQPIGGLFGQPQQNQQQQKPTSSLFGSSNTNPLTASSLNAPVSTGNQGGGLFGSTSSTNTLVSTARGPGGEADAQTQFAALTKRIDGIAAAWNAQNPECRFQHYFYNVVEPAQVNLYGRPQNATNEALWQKAVRENPDPTCLVPVVAIGFDDLRQRANAQSQEAASLQTKLKELKSHIETFSQHATSNSTRLSRASIAQTQITLRLLKLIQHLHLLIPALRSSAIRPEEEALRVRLEEIEEEVRRGRLKGKLNELWAVVGALVNATRGGKEGAGSGTEWVVVDEEGLTQITQILTEQQVGLQHLTKILQRDLKDLAVILGKNGDDEGKESFFGSTSPLRASTLR